MKRALILVTAILVSLGGMTGCSGIDSWLMQGTWEASATIGEITRTTHRLVIDDNAFEYTTLALVPTSKRGTFKADAFSNPKAIDMLVSSVHVGEGSLQIVQNHDPAIALNSIYQLSDGVLKIQFGEDDGARPTSFDEEKMVTLKRVSDK